MRKLLLFVVLLMPMIVNGAAVEIDGIYYNLDNINNTAEVARNSSANCSGNITLPQTVIYQGLSYEVKDIGTNAFRSCSGLTSITIPNSVTSIGNGAFWYCSGLTSITIPNSVTSIGDFVFYYCGLISVTIPNSVTVIGDYAFAGCSGLTSVTIPNSVTNIGDNVFEGCRGLTSVTIPNSLTSIGDYVFYYSGLTSITIPNSVTSLGDYVFSGCSGLTSITIPNSVTSLGDYVFSGCSSLTSVTIPNSVTNIGENVFEDCRGLTSITIPNSVTSIGNNAFQGCSGLTSVTIPNSVINIEDCVFLDCSGLTSITIPNSVTSIGTSAFSGCSGLTSITVPNSVTNIGNSAFSGCSGLTSITVPNSVTSIGTSTFSGCSGLTNVTIPYSVTSIGSRAFFGCSSLTSIIIPNSVTSIGSNAFEGCRNLRTIKVEDGNSTYDSRNNCNAIIETASNTLIVGCMNTTIPNSVTSIGNSAFSGCSGLTSITIPNSVTDIGDYAFYGCSGLISITIPSSVTTIGNCIFYMNSALTDIFCYAESVPRVQAVVYHVPTGRYEYFVGILLDDYSNVTLHVPSGSIEAYASTAPWNNFTQIVPIEEDDLQDYLNSFDDTQDVLSGSIYTRQFLNTEWQSLYVPFSLNYDNWSDNFEVARLGQFNQYDDDDDGKTDRQELEAFIMRLGSDVLNANTPYLIRAKKTGTYNFTVNPSKQVVEQINSVTYSANDSKVVITGNYENQSGLKSAGRYRLMGGSLSIPTKDDEVLPPYRWYATIDNANTNSFVRINFVYETTDVNMIKSEQNDSTIGDRKVYNLQGRRMNLGMGETLFSLPKGIYIIDNKKIIIK